MGSTKQVKYHKVAPRQTIVLIGFMGSGKSVLGLRLARGRGVAFIDLDQMIERRAKQSIPHLFDQLGEARFRQLEAAELKRQTRGGRVVAAGGGILKLPASRRLLRKRKARVVWLNVSWKTLWPRLQKSQKEKRPLLMNARTGRPKAQQAVKQLWRARCAQYRRAAGIQLSIRGRESPEATTRRILALLKI